MADAVINPQTAAAVGAGGIEYTDTNFDRTVTALVKQTIMENARRTLRWLYPGAFIPGKFIPGTNLIRYIAYSDLPVTPALVMAVNSGPGSGYIVQDEGVYAGSDQLTIGYMEFGVTQRTKTLRVTDVALAYSPHDLAAVAGERAGFNALSVLDTVASESVYSTIGTTPTAGLTVYAGGKAYTTLTASDLLSGTEVRKMVARLKSAGIATFPDGTYHAFVHPNATYDLQYDTSVGGWLEVSKYAQPEQMLTGEIGKYAGVRFIETLVGTYRATKVGAGATIDGYQTIFHGPGFFAFGDLQTTQAFIVRPGGDHADPAAQSLLVSWKGMYGAIATAAVGAAFGTSNGPKFQALISAGQLPASIPAI